MNGAPLQPKRPPGACLRATTIALCLLLAAWLPGAARADSSARGEPPGLRSALAKLVQTGGVAVGENGRTVFTHGEGSYVPASIIKLATALAAFHELGPDFRFRTEVFRHQGRLYLRGYGDPFLVSEEWRRMAAMLSARGVFAAPYEALVLDDSAFAGPLRVDGAEGSLNPYDARLGALVTNFNTVFVAVGSDGAVASAEPQTPLTPLAAALARDFPPGEHRINLTARDIPGIRYAGELARAIFHEEGGRFARPPRQGGVPPDAEPVLVYRSSRTLREVVAGMMEFSNNFIANQLVMALAIHAGRNPARLEDGVARLRRFLVEELGLSKERFTLQEGSGLSRNNRIELGAMLAIVDAFHPWRDLLKPYGKPPLTVPAKTGTLTGVYSLAGFLPAPPGTRRPFVIMLNQPRHTRYAVFRHLAQAFGGRAQPTGAAPDRR